MNIKNNKANSFAVKLVPAFFFLVLCATKMNAQMGYTFYETDSLKGFKISNGNNVVRIGTIYSSYFNYRDYPGGVTSDLTKNTFKSKDARIDITGKSGENYEYHLQLDFAGWGAAYAPDAQPLDDANFTYKGFKKIFNINFGYGKVPYSLNSLVEHYQSPYWERPQITKGDAFSRRDLGIRLDRSFWNDRIRTSAGIYTGVGEVVLGGTNDPSGGFEYIGRVEISYPKGDKHEKIIDTKGLKTPNVSIGINGRYSKRNLPAGTSFLVGEAGAMLNGKDSAMEFKVVDGEKYVLGADISILWRNFSAQFETNTIRGTPQNAGSPLLMGLSNSVTKGYFNAGGWYGTLNYFIKPVKTILSVRYDEMNANDLVSGISKHLAAGVSYQVKGYNSMIKLEFNRNLSETEKINTHKWVNEYRLGWQLVID